MNSASPIPPELGQPDASSDNLTTPLRMQLSGPIPPELGNLASLTNLQVLYLENNQLSEPHPEPRWVPSPA